MNRWSRLAILTGCVLLFGLARSECPDPALVAAVSGYTEPPNWINRTVSPDTLAIRPPEIRRISMGFLVASFYGHSDWGWSQWWAVDLHRELVIYVYRPAGADFTKQMYARYEDRKTRGAIVRDVPDALASSITRKELIVVSDLKNADMTALLCLAAEYDAAQKSGVFTDAEVNAQRRMPQPYHNGSDFDVLLPGQPISGFPRNTSARSALEKLKERIVETH